MQAPGRVKVWSVRGFAPVARSLDPGAWRLPGRRWPGYLGLGLALAAVLLAACAREPDEEALRARIGAMVEALEEREAGQFMRGVAEDFFGQEGQLDVRQLHALVRVETMRHRSLGITLGPMEVTMHGDRATVRFTAFASGGSGSFIPEQAGAYEVESGWKKGGDDWVVYTASWARAKLL